MTVTTVCFDLDDTLYAYREYAKAGLSEAAALLERLEVTPDRLPTDGYEAVLFHLYFDEGITTGTFDVLVDRYDLPAELVDDLVDAYHSASSPMRPYPETHSVLSALESEYRLGVVTDGRNGHEKLQRLGIRDYFDAVVVTPMIGRSKHERVVFDQILFALDTSAAESAYVGDDPRVDFRVPNELDMTTVRLDRGRYRQLEPSAQSAAADYRVGHLEALPQILERAGTISLDRQLR